MSIILSRYVQIRVDVSFLVLVRCSCCLLFVVLLSSVGVPKSLTSSEFFGCWVFSFSPEAFVVRLVVAGTPL